MQIEDIDLTTDEGRLLKRAIDCLNSFNIEANPQSILDKLVDMDKATIKNCHNCVDDFYNGKNPYDIKACWNLEKAKLVLRRKVAINEVPPWINDPILVPGCYREKGFVFLLP
jgi:hypothetical protein